MAEASRFETLLKISRGYSLSRCMDVVADLGVADALDNIESGITSVRDAASMGDVTFRLKAWVAENRIAGPPVFPAGWLITAEGGQST